MATLHARKVETLEIPRKGRTRHWDDLQRGLHVRVTSGGARVYKVRYVRPDGRRVDFTIGNVEDVSLGVARKTAGDVIEAAKTAKPGDDPQAVKIKTRGRTDTFELLAAARGHPSRWARR